MYNLRYHLLTIVGIFLALAVGLVLGVALGRSDAVDTTTDSLVSSLQRSFDSLERDNGALQARAQSAESLSDAELAAWARGRLAGARVLVLADDGSLAASDEVRRAVGQAGGEASVASLALPDDASALADGLRDVVDGLPSDRAGLARALGAALASEWLAAPSDAGADAVADACPLTARLREEGVLQLYAPLAEVASCRAVVDVALEGDGAEPVALVVAEAYARAGLPAVATQEGASGKALVEAAWGRGVSGQGGLGTTGGSFGLLWLLTGGMPGAYGVDGRDPWPSASRDAGSSSSSSTRDASGSSDGVTSSARADVPSSGGLSAADSSAGAQR